MTSLRRRISHAMAGVLLATGLSAVTAQAGTLVRMDTTFGSLTFELYDNETPISVENFLQYLDQGAYSRGVVHRLDNDNKVIQGGMIRYLGDCTEGVLVNCSTDWIESDAPIKNESGIPNTRGTLAYARTADVDSATSQWFVNTEDNPAFDNRIDEESGEPVTGYAVFGRVRGDGMQVVDRITELETRALNPSLPWSDPFPQFPMRDISVPSPVESVLVMYNMHEVARYTEALNVFEFQSGRLSLTVDVAGTGPLSLQMVMVGTDPQPIFEVDLDTLVVMALTPEDRGGFGHEADPNILRVPAIEINEHGEIYEMRNAVFYMIDEARLRFQLISFE